MSAPQIRRSPAGKAGLRDRNQNNSVSDHITDTSTAGQRHRLLATLRHQSITTIDARRDLNVMHPAMRVRELRERGHNIVTRLIDIHDDQGRPHSRVAMYSLISGAAT
ncbi:hypothetical protein HDE78_000240 [Rhodanobacter sp. K2T2]|uniref:helix-turn-helix domain-containing protein n=1 Tax=Rhodanobacter sp. K2T2 TaxID=2723085 RepID=UPI0015CD7536|nr:helix-turn-helix domain-containing protein [Rhodanobacter sp. K2T2]NYE27315.1 hypothetical protein [Rhodanobacter sp. K2T2]